MKMIRFPIRFCYSWLFIYTAVCVSYLRGEVYMNNAVNNGNGIPGPGYRNSLDYGEMTLSRYVREADEGKCVGKDTPTDWENTAVTTDREWIEEANEATNVYRRKHGVGDLKISENLCKTAQLWANTMATTKNFNHSNWGCGENIFASGGGIKNVQASTPIAVFYNEVKDYDFNKNAPIEGKNWGNVAHFTALVWKDSKWHCTAMAVNADGDYVATVTQYWPPGNFLYPENLKQNVFPYEGWVLSARSVFGDDDAPLIKGEDGKEYHPCGKVVDKFGDWRAVTFLNETWLGEGVKAINFYRRKHIKTPDVKISRLLCQSAQLWANLITAEKVFGHSPFECFENMWSMNGVSADGCSFDAVVPLNVHGLFYDEMLMYDFRKYKPKAGYSFAKIGHFFPMIWSSNKWACTALTYNHKTKHCIAVNHQTGGHGNHRNNIFLPKDRQAFFQIR